MDKFSSNSYCVGMSVLLAVLLIIVPHWCECDVLQDVCPEGRSVLITNQTEGVNPSYDGGDIEHWFTIARDFVNMVKNENLPYGKYNIYILGQVITCTYMYIYKYIP